MSALPIPTRNSPYSWRARGLLAIALVMAGCGVDDDPPDALPWDTGPAACPPGTMPVEGRCQEAGLPPGVVAGLPPDMPCAPGETPRERGGCRRAGVPPDACGQGFEPDGRGGCDPILPDGPCPPGRMAIPGETACHEVAPCGDGDYGSIPIEASTQFVNAAYPAGDSDGTRAKPWKRIQDGIDHAPSGAIVAVAAGRYPENLLIASRPVRLWGRCPAMVEVVGIGAQTATLKVLDRSARRSEVRALAITGPTAGIGVSGASDVAIDRVWIHDTMGRGIDVDDTIGPTSVSVSASLIERTGDAGVFVLGSDATIESSVVRATRPISGWSSGAGVMLSESSATHERASLALRASLLEQNHDIGVGVASSDATIVDTVIRDTQPTSDEAAQPDSDEASGGGIGLIFRSTLALRSSLLERNHDFGLSVLDADATVEATTIRDTQPSGDGEHAVGISIQGNYRRATMTLRDSLLEKNRGVGVIVDGSNATIEGTVVRDTQPGRDGTGGTGVQVGSTAMRGRASVALRTSLLEQNHEYGLFVIGSDAAIEATVIRDTQPNSNEHGGVGIVVGDDPDIHERGKLMLSTSILERNHEIGVLVAGSDARIDATVVRDTQPASNGRAGRGISLQANEETDERAALILSTSLLEHNLEGGVAVRDSDAMIDATVVRGTGPRRDGRFGDGIGVESFRYLATATITSTRVESNSRAGVSNFNAAVTLVASAVQCNRIALNGENPLEGKPFTFGGSKGNVCGCGDEPSTTCAVRSAGLTPPEPASPIGPTP